MPAALVAKLAESTDIDIAEAEKRWNRAKAITTEEKGLTDKDGDAFWQYVTGVFKRSMGIGAVMESATAEEIHAAAHEAATSHLNDLPQPTQAQLEAGNYAKGHLSLQGLQIAIENPKGSTRRGVDRSGKTWQSTMQHHYGYIKGTIGKDKDHLDVFIGEHPESEFVFVVDQVDPNTRRFDEHKIMLGFTNTKEARAAYLANYEAGWKGLAATTGMTMAMFKIWLKEMDTTKPMQDSVLESAEKAGPGQFFTLDEAREAAKRSPDYWKALMQDATTFDGIRGAFAAKWPEIFGASSPDTAINRLTNNQDGAIGQVSNTTEGDTMTKESYRVEGGHRWTVKSKDGKDNIWYGYNFTPANSGGMFARNHRNGVLRVYFEQDIHGDKKRVEFQSTDYPELLAKYQKDASTVARAFIRKNVLPLVQMATAQIDKGNVEEFTERNEKDGFTKAGQSTAYYIEQLKALGCPEELLQVARDLTAKKKPINENNASEDGVQQETVKWDGSEFYYLSKGEWGFNRIQIMPSNGYVDFGQGFTPDKAPEGPRQMLKDVLPQEFFYEYMETPAAKLLDVEVQKEGRGVWPGPHQNVHVWWQLTNGKAVGWNENPGKGWSFPVITFPSKV